MRKIIIKYYSLNHKNPTKKQMHTLEMEIPDNMGKIDSIEVVSEKIRQDVLVKIL